MIIELRPVEGGWRATARDEGVLLAKAESAARHAAYIGLLMELRASRRKVERRV